MCVCVCVLFVCFENGQSILACIHLLEVAISNKLVCFVSSCVLPGKIIVSEAKQC